MTENPDIEEKYQDHVRPLKNPDSYAILDSLQEAYSWDIHTVDRIGTVAEQIASQDWYRLIKQHIKAGNSKISKNTLIFNISPATDCPHLNSEQCQVPKDSCYAYGAERQYVHSADSPGGPLHQKRRQTVIWDTLDAVTFAETVIDIIDAKTSDTDIEYFRLNEAGDIRSYHDLRKANEIARILNDRKDIQLYLYSATYLNPATAEWFDWPTKENRNFTLLGSNDQVGKSADTRFQAVLPEEINDDDIVCPAELHGRDQVKCGECTLCPEGSVDKIVVPIH